jgi:dienelactone hydrolase
LLAVGVHFTAGPQDLLAPTGPQPVGRRVLRLVDANRPEALSTNRSDRREVTVYVWYPATHSNAPLAPYVDGAEQLSKHLSRDEASLARTSVTHARANAPLAAKPARLPLILLSPGSGSLVALYTVIAEELASHGFIVAGVDHPYDVRAIMLRDGRVIGQAKQPEGGEALLAAQRERVGVRAGDLRFVLDHFTAVNRGEAADPLAGRLDLSHVGAIGHSVGGMTAAEFCMRDARATACANLDGVVLALPVYPDASGKGPLQPFLFMDKPFATMKGEKPEEAATRTAALRQRGNATLTNVKRAHSYRITLQGATHATFSDEEVLTTNEADQRTQLDQVRAYIVRFFDETLKATPATIAPRRDAAITIDVFSP